MTIGILAALQQRNQTGRGQHVEVAMQDAVVNLIRISLREHQRNGVPERTGNQLGKNVPGTTYHCAPGGPNDYVYIYAQPQMWPAVAKTIGQPGLVDDPRFKTADDRWKNRTALDGIIEAWTKRRTKHEVTQLMGDAGVPCGACQDTAEVLADPHLKARDMILEMEYPPRGTFQTVGCPIKLSDSPVTVMRPPMLGEHTGAVLERLCGVAPAEVRKLKEKGVV
jgi:formyl-CoA transferase